MSGIDNLKAKKTGGEAEGQRSGEAEKPQDQESQEVLAPADQPILSWVSAEVTDHKRDVRWYLIVIIACLAIAAFLFFQQNWTGVAMVLVAGMFLLIIRQKHKKTACEIYDKGIVVDDKVYDFTTFKSFWISSGNVPKLSLQSSGRFGRIIDLPLLDVDIDKVRLLIASHLPEEADKGEDLVDIINRIIRF